jgi:hypothetical protein
MKKIITKVELENKAGQVQPKMSRELLKFQQEMTSKLYTTDVTLQT